MKNNYTNDSFLRIVQEPREGTAINFYSPNLCDKTTWYDGSIRVENFEFTDSGDLTTWNGDHEYLIDLYHGKIFNENAVVENYSIMVEVSEDDGATWVEKTQNTFDEADGDYLIDYVNGNITFNSALNSGDKVRASFSKASSSMMWKMSPSTGKRLKLMYAEAQFTTDVEISADIAYETWAYNPLDLPNKIKIGEIRYKTLSDFLYESTGVYPRVSSFGGTGSRGLGGKDILIFPFKYNSFRDIRNSQGVEIRITTKKEHVGTMATATLYCLEEDE